VDDIFTRKDTISGLKSSLWAGLGNWSEHPWTVQFSEFDITTFGPAFGIANTLQIFKVSDR